MTSLPLLEREYFKSFNAFNKSEVKCFIILYRGDLDSTGVNSIVNWIINAFFDPVFKDSINLYIEKVLTADFEKAINAVFTKVPIKELFIVHRH